MRKMFALLSLLVLASMVLAACGGAAPTTAPAQPAQPQVVVVTATPGPTEPPPAKEAVLRINLGTYPDTIDPQKSSFVNEIAHLKLMYEGLTTFNEKLETVPGAAESWKYNADSTVLTFQIRSGLKYSDGSLLNAARFAYSLKRNIDPATAGEYGSITDDILNAAEWRTGAHLDGSNACKAATCTDDEKKAFEDGLGIKASHTDGSDCKADDSGSTYADADCLVLTLTMSHPAPYFHTIMGIWVAYPAKQENIETGGEIWWTSPVYQVGNGPFIWDVGEPFVKGDFSPNPNYWGKKPTYKLEYRYITDSAVAFEAYKNNELDINPSAAEDLDTINADADLKAQHMVYAGACTIVFKYGLAGVYKDPSGKEYDSPFKDPKVREAFAYAFDAEGYAKNVDSGLSTATWTWIPPGFPGYSADSPMKYDPDAAKAALAASTYGGPDKLNALGMKLTFPDSPRNRARSEYLAANFKDVLGVDFTLDPIEATTFTAITKDPKTFPLFARQGWCADYPDQQDWLSVYWKSTTTFAQRQGYVNLDFDKLVDQADKELDPAKRADLYKQAQDLLLKDFPSAFGYNTANHYLVKPWVKGILTTPQDSDWPGSFAVANITIDTSMIP